MCHKTCVDFVTASLSKKEIQGKAILEIGSRQIAGALSLRPIILPMEPSKFIGIDIQEGNGVDQIAKAEDLIQIFGQDAFDVLVCVEMLEHVMDWTKVIHNLKGVVKPGGILLITTRSFGYKYHTDPFDFWRYEIDDMEKIFSDFNIDALEQDPTAPGVFVKVTKPIAFVENNLKNHKLYSIFFDKKINVSVINYYFILSRIRDFFAKILPSSVKENINKFLRKSKLYQVGRMWK